MYKIKPNQAQQTKINNIVQKHINQARHSNKETAYQDAERKGMDEVIKYCRDSGISITGAHIRDANDRFWLAA